MQKTYGKTRDEIETLVEGFSWALDGYEVPEITDAFRKYIMERDDIPSPANIREIIIENRKYANIQRPSIEKLIEYQKKGIPLTEDQQNQLRDYEKHSNIMEAV